LRGNRKGKKARGRRGPAPRKPQPAAPREEEEEGETRNPLGAQEPGTLQERRRRIRGPD